ncbi:MAG: hypothetical protein R2712_04415 [Vicinamibacterales bacterium]
MNVAPVDAPLTHYRRVLPGGLVIASARPEHAEALEALQRVVFPTLADDERFKAPHYRRHLELFPEGQFVGLDGSRVVAATATIRMHFDFGHVDHTFADILQGGWLTSHVPAGDWLYGADLGVHPDYRGRGLAGAMRRPPGAGVGARPEGPGDRGHDGERGFGAVKDRMTAEA